MVRPTFGIEKKKSITSGMLQIKYIYSLLSVFLMSSVLSTGAIASSPPYYRDCYAMIHDPVLWNHGQPPNTRYWTWHCWSLVYYELGRWHFDQKIYEKRLLQEDQRRERLALERERREVWMRWAEKRRALQIKYGNYDSL